MRANIMLGFAFLLSTPVHVVAQVYKCADDRQQAVYQDQPCPAGRELRDFATDPPALSVIPLRPVPGSTTRLAAPTVPRTKTGGGERKSHAQTGDPTERRYIHPGMHEGEVVARIGTPDMKSGGGSRRVARWTYLPHPGDPQTLTTVVLDTGKVVEVERKVMK